MLENTLFFALFAAAIVAILIRRIQPEEFRNIPWWRFGVAAAVFWGILSLILVLSAWNVFYSHFTPEYYRVVAPLAALLIYPLWSLALRWIASKFPLHPILGFCLLGGIQGLFEHAVAIYRLNLLAVPFLEGSTPGAIFLLAFFEYIGYWGLVAVLVILLGRIQDRFWPVSGSSTAASG